MARDAIHRGEAAPDWDALDEPGLVLKAAFRCERPSRYAGWMLPDGRVVPARCGAPNKCAYCAYQVTVENSVVVHLDAERHGHPKVGMTLTTAKETTPPPVFRKDVEVVFRAVRRRAPACEYLGLVEFSTGRGARSGGVRRPHQHLLLKGVLPSQAEQLEDVVRDVWKARTGADRIEFRELRSPAGATAYLIHHHRKREQAPPEGWKGKRMRPSRGYYGEPVAALRVEAKELLRSRRLRRVARRLVAWDDLHGAPDVVIEQEMTAAIEEARDAAAAVEFVKIADLHYLGDGRWGRKLRDDQGHDVAAHRSAA